MQPGDYFEHEDFLNVFDFNTPQTVAALGTAISQSSELVLRQIEVTIKTVSYTHLDVYKRQPTNPSPVRKSCSPPGVKRSASVPAAEPR